MKKALILILGSLLSAPAFGQRVGVETVDGAPYAVISAEGMPHGAESRDPAQFYYNSPLYDYATNQPITDGGNQVYVKRILRHGREGTLSYYNNGTSWVSTTYSPSTRISAKFAVAPSDIDEDGNPLSGAAAVMSWDKAAGYLVSAQNNATSTESSASNKGCYMYRGKNGTDERGTWRLPTMRELIICKLFSGQLTSTASSTGFSDFRPYERLNPTYSRYWAAAEADQTTAYNFNISDGIDVLTNADVKRGLRSVRCVRDLP